MRRGRRQVNFVQALAIGLLLSVPARADLSAWLGNLLHPIPQVPHPAMVQIQCREKDAYAQGSGTLIARDERHGWVITNWHVVRDAIGPVQVIFPDGFHASGQVLKTDETWDLALVLIPRPPANPLPLATQVPRIHEPVTISGYGQGTFRTVSGRCTNYAAPDQHHPQEMIDISVAARQGDSGGPILNARGELAGVLFGSGQGGTTGTHVGRVRMFLLNPTMGPEQLATGNLQEVAPRRQPVLAKSMDPSGPAASSTGFVSPAGFVSPEHSGSAPTPLSPAAVESYGIVKKEEFGRGDGGRSADPDPFAELAVAESSSEARVDSTQSAGTATAVILGPPQFDAGAPKTSRPICDPVTGVCALPTAAPKAVEVTPAPDQRPPAPLVGVSPPVTPTTTVTTGLTKEATADPTSIAPEGDSLAKDSRAEAKTTIRRLDDTSAFLVFVGCVGLFVGLAPRKK